ncbi:amino acid ABC transporter permease [Tardiphaga sp. vice352]|uniref:amino acid ABC transporter permease n=2 Tax=Tardiphaga TaxID=1395974 RepID=UPI001162DCB8|nr:MULTISPECIES: amino acid ABC transporter permease [unclassified Tardiphaga]QDM17294.1 amino acid ABC transporter permease [Tardiphaga sp. vice278]QDM22268.1 amino acid ABC transporter permease [Tardiphaga sp. vice154]QDM32668.1 amino acid ABC transporter permease [Tardiphaga sp. vice352]
MSEPAFISNQLIPERAAPVKTTGVTGFVRNRLLNSPTNVLLTMTCLLLLWFSIVPAVKFLLIDAVWTGRDRTACLAETTGRAVGACWPFVQAKFSQFIYGFYPQPERWRVNLTFGLAALLLLPLLIPKLPAKSLNAGLFFIAFPIVAFFLLYGGGIRGFGIAWSEAALASFANALVDGGQQLAQATSLPMLSAVLRGLGGLIELTGYGLAILLWPLTFLRKFIESSSQPVWADFLATALIVSAIMFLVGGGFRNGWRALIASLTTFAGIAMVIAILRLDRQGLPVVATRMWGGLLVTMVVSVTGIVASMPVGIALALGRRSTIPLIRVFCVAFIEFWRGLPLITVLFFATYMLPLFLPGNFTVDGLVRVLIGIALFAGAYNAEVIRGGLNAIPRGQAEAASALGLSYWKTTGLVVMPQALRHVIPGLVNSFIAMLKDTSLVSIVALFDLLGQLRASFADPTWSTPSTLFTGFAFAGMIYFVLCFGMSRYSLFVEHRLNAHRRN